MKRRTRRSFTNEFKHEAASLVIDQGYTMAEACRAMGVGSTAMRRWVLQLEGEHRGITPKAKALTPDQQRIQELEHRVKQLNTSRGRCCFSALQKNTIIRKAQINGVSFLHFLILFGISPPFSAPH